LILLAFPLLANAQTGTPIFPDLNADALSASMRSDPAWEVTKTGDLNGDGNPDLIVHNASTGQTAVWIMNGTTLTGWTLLLTSPDWNVIEAVDLNGDGKTDLLWYDASTGQSVAWLMGDVTATSWAVLIYSLDDGATFTAAGTYALRITANDGSLTANGRSLTANGRSLTANGRSLTANDGSLTPTDDVIEIVTGTRPPTNLAPVVDAGPDQIITFPSAAMMVGAYTDDGLPSGSMLIQTWSKVSGPGTVIFGNPSLLNTTATFSLPGSYTLRFTVSDGTLSTSDDVIIAVVDAESCGAMVSGAMAVVADASDDVAVVGVQVKLDDTNMGSELTSSPFSIMWDTATASNGCHTLSAVARDAAGNLGTTALLVTVSNP
jgi:hypothetical protein